MFIIQQSSFEYELFGYAVHIENAVFNLKHVSTVNSKAF